MGNIKGRLDPEASVLAIGGSVALTAGATGLILNPEGLYQNGFLGLMTFLFGISTIALGKSPIGEAGGWRLKLVGGTILALIGMTTAFLPDSPERYTRWILFMCLCPGGLAQLMEMLLSNRKLPTWKAQGGPLKTLAITCIGVYCASVLLGAAVLLPQKPLTPLGKAQWALASAYGIGLLVLSLLIARVREIYPKPEEELRLPIMRMERSMMFVTGIFMTALGITLIPVSLGILKFSGDAQLGLLLIIMSIQIMATGNTPLGMMAPPQIGMPLGVFGSVLGTLSSLIPGALTVPLTITVAVFNLAGGALGLKGLGLSRSKTMEALIKMGREKPPSPLIGLWQVQTAMNCISILFGISMLVRHLIPGWIVGMILTMNGLMLMVMMRLLDEIQRLSSPPNA
ncbi:hypothetical protein TheveDRAFT_1252 [Thermanaerovibrio velox DSM 12556]|uniref:Uncharacterized protein n=1 Tax=Thermanaerovibrio velox DSM 12556 TaxID=926567 RepID=H0UN87_9BACT|nr:hypothetical protein [Thermanaerovibrio velox]EHM10372.1 hypothetical protein TheveDRAFT_1252 [Thermanaerovibrio velox DSM 12556]